MTTPHIEHILVPVDFSEGSRRALEYALGLAGELGAKVDTLHVWEPTPYVSPSQTLWLAGQETPFWDHVKRQLDERLDELVREVAGARADDIGRRVEAGYVAQSIVEAIEAGSYDLVVMGTHGRTGLKHLLLGSIAERVVRLAPCAVLTIRSEAHEQLRGVATSKGFVTHTDEKP